MRVLGEREHNPHSARWDREAGGSMVECSEANPRESSPVPAVEPSEGAARCEPRASGSESS